MYFIRGFILSLNKELFKKKFMIVMQKNNRASQKGGLLGLFLNYQNISILRLEGIVGSFFGSTKFKTPSVRVAVMSSSLMPFR